MKNLARTVFLGGVLLLAACGGSPDTSDATTSTSSVAASTVATTTTTTEPPPPIKVVSYSPNDSNPIEVLVVLRGDEHLFDPAAEVIGGSGELTFAWDFDGDPETVESDQMDPDPARLEPGEYFPTLTVTDDAGQALTIELPRVVKVDRAVEPDWTYGVMAHVNLPKGYYEDEEEIVRALDLIAGAGIQAIRVDFEWTHLECWDDGFQVGSGGCCGWLDYDHMVELAHSRGLEIVGLIGFSPEWASSAPEEPDFWTYPPNDPAEYGEFVLETARRYRGKVRTWEIWCEPNITVCYRGDPQSYFPLLREAYLAVKYADPLATVLVGGLANGPAITGIDGIDPEQYLQELLQLGAAQYSDGSALHPYTDPFLGTSTLIERINSVRAVMDKYGAADQLLWITEIGYPTGFQVWTEEVMAIWLRDSFDAMAAIEGVGPIIWYNFKNKDQNPIVTERHYGLVTGDLEPKQTYLAYQAYIEDTDDE